MRKLIKKAVSLCTCFALLLTMFATTITASALTTNDYYNTYTTVADIADRSSCTAMQGLAVGSTWLYTVKIKSDNSSAVLQKTNKNTGATTNLTDSNGSATYSYLNHANDMDVTTIDGYSQLYIATMTTGSNSLVRMKIDGSKATKAGSYTIMLNGAEKSVSAVSVVSTTDSAVNFLFKVGTQVYSGSVAKSATSGTINITPAFKINTSSVKVNGSVLNLSSYTHQGMGYHDGKIYVPLWGGGAGNSNVAIIAVYDTYNASGTVTSDPFLSFRITSSAYTGFEIEGCDVSSDGKLYFSANRWTSSSGNCDGVFSFNGYTSGNNPDGNVDVISGGAGSVYVRGWAFDKDCLPISIEVHVYIGGTAGNGEGHAITANTARTDVNAAFGCGDYHGFEATIGTSLRGSQPVYIYAINVRSGTNVCIGSGTVNITDETNPPTISNISISEVSISGYRVSCNVYDESGISYVEFPTWTDNNGQDDLIWHQGTVSGNTATCYISVLDHKSEFENYITHIYAYDAYGNSNVEVVNVDVKSTPSNLGDDFYANISFGGKNLSLNGNNVVIYDKDGTTSENWHFIRQSDGSYKIVNMSNGRCLDVADASGEAGANVQLYDDNGSTAQRWYIYDNGGKYVFRAVCAPSCALDVDCGSTENGTNVQQWTFYGNEAQQFEINTTMTPVNLGDDFFANISYGGKNLSLNVDVDNVILYDKDGSTPQNWHFIRHSDGSYKIVSMFNGKCLDVAGGSSESGENVRLYDDNDSAAQRWYIYQHLDKYVFKAACAPNCALDVDCGSTANYTNIQQWTYNGSSAQQFEINTTMFPFDSGDDFYANISYSGKNISLNVDADNVILYEKDGSTPQVWHFIRQSDGGYKIVNIYNGKCLDVANASGEAGANVQIYDDNETSAQRWFIYNQGGGKYIFRAVCSPGCALDVKDASNENGTNIQMWTYYVGGAQQFEINKVEPAAKSELNVTVNTKTLFNWSESAGTENYGIKIWNGNAFEGEAYKTYTTTEKSYEIALPAGNYQACVYSYNSFSSNTSEVISFTVENSQLLGDVNGDGLINIRDVTELQKYLVGFKNGIIEANADVNYDGTINIRDATEIQKHIVGMIDFS